MMNLLFEMARIGDAVRGRDILVDIVLHGGNDRIREIHSSAVLLWKENT